MPLVLKMLTIPFILHHPRNAPHASDTFQKSEWLRMELSFDTIHAALYQS
jgi:hypothetical protein